MALPPQSVFRVVAAAIALPASEEDMDHLRDYIAGLTEFNEQGPRIIYRNDDRNQDLVEAVYRWDTRPYQDIFETGFRRRPQGATSNADYYNFMNYVNNAGRPGNPGNRASVFVSTTRLASWRPPVSENCTLYRYEIYAPGGIDAVLTLGGGNENARRQQEISFAGGICPQYIRTARAYSFTVNPGNRFPNIHGNSTIHANAIFNPDPGPDGYCRMAIHYVLRNPVCPARGDILIWCGNREKRSTEDHEDPICNTGHYIESAFNFSDKEEVYLFIANQCLLMNYAPGTTDDYIIKQPQSIGDAFPYLKETIFASGIDAAFTASKKNEAYIFRSNIYALINFAADGGGSIIQGPKLITDSFYSLKNTIFANGIDAAFTSSTKNEAYIFRDNQYALINFAPGTTDDYIIQGPKKITDSFYSLKGTIFEDGLDAAFSAFAKDEAYIFKGETYALINYATDNYIIQGPKKITESFYSLNDIIPMHPCDCAEATP